MLVATPVTAIGTPRSLVLGAALAALTVCFLWLERLPLRPGLGVAVLAGVALAGALPLSVAADRDEPVVRLHAPGPRGSARPPSVRFDWDHSYGPLRWRREGREMLRIRSRRAQYWKLENLEDFDGERWVERGTPDRFGPGAEADLDDDWASHPQWTGDARVTVRGLRGDPFAGAGTTLSVDAGARQALPTFSPGTWEADHELAAGDSYRVRFHAPRPNPLQLAAATSGARGQQGDALELLLPLVRPELPDARRHAQPPGHALAARAAAVRVDGAAAGAERAPRDDRAGPPGAAQLPLLADVAARAAAQARRPQPHTSSPAASTSTWTAASATTSGRRTRRRRAAARALPVRGQGRLLPALLGRDGAAAAFRRGARARGHRLLARRLPPPPARVGRARPRRALVGRGVVRRHRLGHVRPDADRHARALADRRDRRADRDRRERLHRRRRGDAARWRPQPRGRARDELTRLAAARPARPATTAGAPRGWYAGGGLALLAALALWWRRRRREEPAAPADRAIADLVVALRRAGRPVPPGVTLTELERRLGGGRGYLAAAALRALRHRRERARPPNSAARSAASSPRASAGAGACARGGRCRRGVAEPHAPQLPAALDADRLPRRIGAVRLAAHADRGREHGGHAAGAGGRAGRRDRRRRDRLAPAPLSRGAAERHRAQTSVERPRGRRPPVTASSPASSRLRGDQTCRRAPLETASATISAPVKRHSTAFEWCRFLLQGSTRCPSRTG